MSAVSFKLMPRPDGSGEWGIIYNESIRSAGRRNFTLAHELGHYLLHRRDHPGGLQCTNRNMADWDGARNRIEAEANTFASYLLMPLDDFRTQIKGRPIDIDVMTELADRYAVSLTAAILKWMTVTDKRAMIVVGKEGFIDWAWSSQPLLRSGIFYAARQTVIELPARSLAAREVDADNGRHGERHEPGVWLGNEPVHEMTVFSPSNEMMTISLLTRPRPALLVGLKKPLLFEHCRKSAFKTPKTKKISKTVAAHLSSLGISSNFPFGTVPCPRTEDTCPCHPLMRYITYSYFMRYRP
jgi:hypothetical protein